MTREEKRKEVVTAYVNKKIDSFLRAILNNRDAKKVEADSEYDVWEHHIIKLRRALEGEGSINDYALFERFIQSRKVLENTKNIFNAEFDELTSAMALFQQSQEAEE